MKVRELVTAIRERLLANEVISEKVHKKIFPISAPLDTKGTFIVYQRDGIESESCKMCLVKRTVKIAFTIVSENYDESLLLLDELEKTLMSFQVNCMNDSDSTEDKVEDKFIQVGIYNFNI